MVEFSVSEKQQSFLKSEYRRFLRISPLLSLVGAMLGGVLLWGAFNWSLEITNTEQFCISCHVMRNNVYQELKETIHFKNRSGVRATCPDCHVPNEWVFKVARKIRATGELYHWLVGTISTREKFEKRRPLLAQYVWETMKKTDSRECRNCHKNNSMEHSVQTIKAAKMHELGASWGKTCIDCHRGIAHRLPAGHNEAEVIEDLHERFAAEKIVCRDCHTDMAGTPVDEDGWAKE